MNKNTTFLFSKDDIIDYIKEDLFDSENTSTNSDKYTNSNVSVDSVNNSIETFQFNNLLTAYNFASKQITLWKEHSNDKYELLYECNSSGDLCKAGLYIEDDVFLLNNYNSKTGHIGSLDFTSKDSYFHVIDIFMKNSKNIFSKKVSYTDTLRYMDEHFKTLIYNNKYCSNDEDKYLIKKYQNLYAKYLSTSNHIPIYNILKDFLADMHSYIATKKFDMNVFSKHLFKLYNFEEACPSSISLISSFIENHSGTDLQKLCDSLERNIRNVENLIHLYCKDELESQKEGEEL